MADCWMFLCFWKSWPDWWDWKKPVVLSAVGVNYWGDSVLWLVHWIRFHWCLFRASLKTGPLKRYIKRFYLNGWIITNWLFSCFDVKWLMLPKVSLISKSKWKKKPYCIKIQHHWFHATRGNHKNPLLKANCLVMEIIPGSHRELMNR